MALQMFGVMNELATLTRRESEIAELFAWGATKKDIANRLYVSERTIENHARTIYDKVGCRKVNELSAWWFCTHFNISFDLSPLKRKILSGIMLLLITPQIFSNTDNIVRVFRIRTTTTRVCRNFRRKTEIDSILLDY